MALLPEVPRGDTAEHEAAKISTPTIALAERLRVVLLRTSHPGNIGASARAMRTMGLRRLVLVAPDRFPDPEAEAMASGASELLAEAEIGTELAAALSDVHFAFGTTARRRGVSIPFLAPREAAAEALRRVRAGQRVAVVFGNERTGLENEELALCQAAVMIPANPEYPSLNLAQAVQILCYELRIAALAQEQQASPFPARRDPPATLAEFEGLMAHLARYLERIDFHKGRSPKTVLLRIRRMLQRADLDRREVRILRGILSDSERLLGD